jgi:cell shape-determining protein MreC
MLDISPDKGEHLDGSILEEKRIYDEKKKIDLFLFTDKNYVKNLNKDLTEQTKNFESSIIESKNSEIELEIHRRKLERLKQKVNELEEKISESKFFH